MFSIQQEQEIEKVELCVGGDHGQGAFTMMMIVIVRYKNGKSRHHEFQIGQIDAKEDTIEYLRPLLNKLKPSFVAMKFIEGKCCIERADDGKVVYIESNESNNGIPVEIFLIGEFLCAYQLLTLSMMSD